MIKKQTKSLGWVLINILLNVSYELGRWLGALHALFQVILAAKFEIGNMAKPRRKPSSTGERQNRIGPCLHWGLRAQRVELTSQVQTWAGPPRGGS